MKKIGIMGGTFNPIHIGHLSLAQRVLDDLTLDEIWFIPTGCSYMKADEDSVLPDERYHMTSLAIANNSRMKCLDIEVKRQGYTYTYETMEQLKKAYPQASFFFIFGADCLFQIEDWRYPERIFQNCTVVASVRNGTSIEAMEAKIAELKERFHAEIILYPFINLEISSTDLRERIREGKSIQYLVPDNVLAYIVQKRFYMEDK